MDTAQRQTHAKQMRTKKQKRIVLSRTRTQNHQMHAQRRQQSASQTQRQTRFTQPTTNVRCGQPQNKRTCGRKKGGERHKRYCAAEKSRTHTKTTTQPQRAHQKMPHTQWKKRLNHTATAPSHRQQRATKTERESTKAQIGGERRERNGRGLCCCRHAHHARKNHDAQTAQNGDATKTQGRGCLERETVAREEWREKRREEKRRRERMKFVPVCGGREEVDCSLDALCIGRGFGIDEFLPVRCLLCLRSGDLLFQSRCRHFPFCFVCVGWRCLRSIRLFVYHSQILQTR